MQESKQNNSRKLLLGMLLGLLLVVLGMFAVLLTMLPEEEKMGRLNPEDAFYVRRVISAQPTYKDKDNAYIEAVELLRNGRFMEAADVFEYLGDYADSADMVKDCDYAKASERFSSGQWSSAKEIFLSDPTGKNLKMLDSVK